MGMSTHVTLLRDKNDEEYQKMLKIMKACKEADIDPPRDVDFYFGGDGIDGDLEYPLEIEFEPRKWEDISSEGFEIDIDDLPSGVKTIRFYNSF